MNIVGEHCEGCIYVNTLIQEILIGIDTEFELYTIEHQDSGQPEVPNVGSICNVCKHIHLLLEP